MEAAWRSNLWVCFFGSFTTVMSMTLVLPFLPLYVRSLGVHDPAAAVQWSGIAYGATFLTAGLAAPVWGRLGDKYGRKSMLIRASLGMAAAMSLVGMVQELWQLIALRLLIGLLGGYSSGAMVLVAAQTPKASSGWALGVLSSGIMAGSLLGPMAGGLLPPLVGMRWTFFGAGAVIFLAFLATVFLLKEPGRPVTGSRVKFVREDRAGTDRKAVVTMLATGCLLMVANMSVEPILAAYVEQLVRDQWLVTAVAGAALAAGALGSLVSAPWLGKAADRWGPRAVVTGCLGAAAVLLIPQAFLTEGWQLVGLRFTMGLALGGLLPSIAASLRHAVPERMTGRVLGLSTSAQYLGQVLGPVGGGFAGAHWGMQSVFLGTSLVMALGAILNLAVRPGISRASPAPPSR